MSTFVLVHGAWHGGWVWNDLARELRDLGHSSVAPTLPCEPGTTLATHVSGIHDVVRSASEPVSVVAHSYAGVIAPQVASLAPDRVSTLILVDGWVTRRGQSLFDVAPTWFTEWCMSTAAGPSDARVLPPPPASALGITDADLTSLLEARLTPQPLGTFTEAAEHDLPSERPAMHAIACTPVATMPFGDMAREADYTVHEIESHHDVMLSKPRELANLLHDIVSAPGPSRRTDR